MIEQQVLDSSKEIWKSAKERFGEPYSTVLMLSGGRDSLSVFYVAKELGIDIDYICHIDTGTGIPQTTQWVEEFAADQNTPFILGSAGNKYEEWVKRRGFFGRGRSAHSMAFHLLKRDVYTNALSVHIRKRKRNRRIFLLNGVRLAESDNRKQNFEGRAVKPDKPKSPNIWVNLIQDWDKPQCRSLCSAHNAPVNPVAQMLCRSGECFCGTTQSQDERKEASLFFPEWGDRLDKLEREVQKTYPWGWGENIPKGWKAAKKAESEKQQMPLLPDNSADFQPLCSDCIKRAVSDAPHQQVDS